MGPAIRFGVCVALAAAVAGGARAAGDATRGRKLSIQHCARCHVIGKYNRLGGLGSTPSFVWMKELPNYRNRILTFYARNPHPAFTRVPGQPHLKERISYASEFTITQADIRDILAYVETLNPPKPRARRGAGKPTRADKASKVATERMREYVKSLAGGDPATPTPSHETSGTAH